MAVGTRIKFVGLTAVDFWESRAAFDAFQGPALKSDCGRRGQPAGGAVRWRAS